MQQSTDFESNNSSKVCLLKKAICDLKQSARMWYETLKNFLTDIGFIRIRFDHFVFIHENGIIIAIYVNDLLLAEPKLKNILDFKKKLSGRFRVKNLEEIKFYLKIKIIQNRKNRKMVLSQTAFIKQLIRDCGFDQMKTRPIATLIKCINFEKKFNDKSYEAISEKINAYQMILRSCQWLATMTRQDIAYATNKLAQFSLNPTSTHTLTLKHVIRYLAKTS